ncbi:MAG: zinc ribbon domain-containing protein [Candidatus Binatia bacterium]
MPIYEYSCRKCDNTFEELLLSPRMTVACPKCESHTVERKLSVFRSPRSGVEKGGANGGCSCTPSTCACH